MPDLRDIIGNEILKKHFKTAIKQNKISHAYILEGEKGIGKKTMASAFAKILQCEKKLENKKGYFVNDMKACCRCESCIQMENKNHPDVIWVDHEKSAVISVDEIRNQVVNTVDIMPYKGPYKIYIVDEAEKMNTAAQNAILKTIEEPPEYTVIMLLTSNRGAFLPTILSRCILLAIKPVADIQVKKYLIENLHVDEKTADFCMESSMGNIGKAVDMALSEDFMELRNFSISLLRYIDETEIFEIVDKVKKMKKWKESIDDFMDMVSIWFRDVLMVKVHDDEEMLIFKEEYPAIRKQSKLIQYEELNDIFSYIDSTRLKIKSNVNYDASLEMMIINIKNTFSHL